MYQQVIRVQKEFWLGLWNDDVFRESWINQSMIYVNSDMSRVGPTLDRID
ncbi:hypothetical protein [Paenibacillus sp. GM1FR]|nr:hypothetical protein [Paenibacillus sp. GM1FR]